jgi:hypothetical protein
MKNEIARWGWYNGLFMHEFQELLEVNPSATIQAFHTDFRKDFLNGIEFPLKNQGLVISMLYMVLVIPRELWEKEKIETNFKFNTKNHFTFIIPENDIDNWDFLSMMRNAISHANFDMTDDGIYSFWNISSDKNINFKVTICHCKLFEFINEVGKYYINEVAPKL